MQEVRGLERLDKGFIGLDGAVVGALFQAKLPKPPAGLFD